FQLPRDRLIGPWCRRRRRSRKININIDRRQRCRDHEDDQQHEHDINERCHIDLVTELEIITLIFTNSARHNRYSAARNSLAWIAAVLKSNSRLTNLSTLAEASPNN